MDNPGSIFLHTNFDTKIKTCYYCRKGFTCAGFFGGGWGVGAAAD